MIFSPTTDEPLSKIKDDGNIHLPCVESSATPRISTQKGNSHHHEDKLGFETSESGKQKCYLQLIVKPAQQRL